MICEGKWKRYQLALTIGRAGVLTWIAAWLVPALLIAAPAGQTQVGHSKHRYKRTQFV